MIVVVGRPGLSATAGTVAPGGGAAPSSTATGVTTLAGMPAQIALAAAARGARVQVVGSVGDDPEGDRVAVELGRAGVGHAALLRDPAGATPIEGTPRGQPPRLDADDVDLGLRYLADYRVLVLAETLAEDAQRTALDGAAYHGAHVIAIVPTGGNVPRRLADVATVLESPTDEDEPSVAARPPFAAFVGAFAASLDAGHEAAEALAEAAASAGWERSTG